MINVTLEIDEKKINFEIPNSWEDITVQQYMDMLSLMKDIKEITTQDSLKIISLLSGVDVKLIGEMSPDEFKLLTDEVQFVYDPIPNNKLESIMIEGEEYFVKKDFSKQLTMGEVASIELITKQNEDVYKALPELLTIFLRKKIDGRLEKYSEIEEDRSELFRNVKITQVHYLMGFFSTGKDT